MGLCAKCALNIRAPEDEPEDDNECELPPVLERERTFTPQINNTTV